LWLGAARPLFRDSDLPDLLGASVALGHPKVSRCATPTGRSPWWRHDKVCGPVVVRLLAIPPAALIGPLCVVGPRTSPSLRRALSSVALEFSPAATTAFPSLTESHRRARQTQPVGVIEPRRGEERGRGWGHTHGGREGAHAHSYALWGSLRFCVGEPTSGYGATPSGSLRCPRGGSCGVVLGFENALGVPRQRCRAYGIDGQIAVGLSTAPRLKPPAIFPTHQAASRSPIAPSLPRSLAPSLSSMGFSDDPTRDEP